MWTLIPSTCTSKKMGALVNKFCENEDASGPTGFKILLSDKPGSRCPVNPNFNIRAPSRRFTQAKSING